MPFKNLIKKTLIASFLAFGFVGGVSAFTQSYAVAAALCTCEAHSEPHRHLGSRLEVGGSNTSSSKNVSAKVYKAAPVVFGPPIKAKDKSIGHDTVLAPSKPDTAATQSVGNNTVLSKPSIHKPDVLSGMSSQDIETMDKDIIAKDNAKRTLEFVEDSIKDVIKRVAFGNAKIPADYVEDKLTPATKPTQDEVRLQNVVDRARSRARQRKHDEREEFWNNHPFMPKEPNGPDDIELELRGINSEPLSSPEPGVIIIDESETESDKVIELTPLG